jgi:anti-anti-sigma regulatory factor
MKVQQAAERFIPGSLTVIFPVADAALVELRGDHDLALTSKPGGLRETLPILIDAHPLVAIDLSDASFIDSSVISTLMVGHSHARERGSSLRIQLGGAPVVRRALELSGVFHQLDVVETRNEALRPPAA